MERKHSESGIAQLFFGTPVGRNLKQSVVYNTIHLLLFVIYMRHLSLFLDWNNNKASQ